MSEVHITIRSDRPVRVVIDTDPTDPVESAALVGGGACPKNATALEAAKFCAPREEVDIGKWRPIRSGADYPQ